MIDVIETDRLKIRPFKEEDALPLFNIMADGGMPHLENLLGPLDVNYARGFIIRMLDQYQKEGLGLWAVFEKKSDTLIGYCGVHSIKINGLENKYELAYRIHKQWWNKGFATEAAVAICDYVFNVLSIHEIVSCIDPNNEASIRVAEKVGLLYWKDDLFKGMLYRIYRKEK